VDVLATGGKDLSGTNVDGYCAAGTQRNARYASVAGVAAVLAEAAGECDDEDDGQRKKKTGTTTMHEPSSRPFARREHKAVGRKTVSVEGKAHQVQGFKVSGFQSCKVRAGIE